MKGELTTLAPGGGFIIRSYTAPVPLRELQVAVGGYIELVPNFYRFQGQPCIAFCDEDGKRKHVHENTAATAHWQKCQTTFDHLVGPVVVATGDAEFLASF